MESLKRGRSLLVTFYEIEEHPREEESRERLPPISFTNLGEILIEENPASAERVADLQGYLTRYSGLDGTEETGVFGGFNVHQPFIYLLLNALRALGIGQP